MDKIKMIRCRNGSISLKEFSLVEEVLEVTFPNSFKSLIRDCDEGFPKDNGINFYDNTLENIMGTCIGAFLSFKKNFLSNEEEHINEDAGIIDFYKKPGEFFPDFLIAFAVDPFGNYFCFDYRSGKDNLDPPVVFWNHEGAGNPEAISFLENNFGEFLKMIKIDEEAEKEYQELKRKYANKK